MNRHHFKYFIVIVFSTLTTFIYAIDLPPLPQKISNNAVAVIKEGNHWTLYSFNGLGENRGHQDVMSNAWAYSSKLQKWSALPDVPDSHLIDGGRLASIAVSVNNKIYLFGGYTVAPDNSEVSTPESNVYDLVTQSWQKAPDMPTPVDDSVALVFQQRYIYLISGWHNSGNISDVQLFDTLTERWLKATNFPGATVFGHAAGIVDNQIIIANGVTVASIDEGRRQYEISEEVWKGTINTSDPSQIKWQKIMTFPGGGRYRMAAVADNKLPRIHFVGGSLNPYNYNGIGYNKIPSQPESKNYAYDLENDQWLFCGNKTPASMDHRGLLPVGDKLITVGGMLKNQQVTNKVLIFKPNCLLEK